MDEIGLNKSIETEDLQIFRTMDPKPKRLPKITQKSCDTNFDANF